MLCFTLYQLGYWSELYVCLMAFSCFCRGKRALYGEEAPFWPFTRRHLRPCFSAFLCHLVCVLKVTICHICHLHWLQVRELLEWVSEAPFCSFPRCWTGAPPLFATPGGRKAASQLALSQSEASPLRSHLTLSEGAVSLTDLLTSAQSQDRQKYHEQSYKRNLWEGASIFAEGISIYSTRSLPQTAGQSRPSQKVIFQNW